MYSPLEKLPDLILEQIGEYLTICQARRYSLFAFSLTSKRCCEVAARERFERIRLAVNDSQELNDAVQRWDSILKTGNRSRYVRRIYIVGRLKVDGEDAHQSFAAKQFIDQMGMDDDDSDHEDDAFGQPTSLSGFSGSGEVESRDNNARWQPVAEFIYKLAALQHLIWASTDQVPRCMLDVLHSRLPNARLHVNTFSFRSLYQKVDHLHDVDPDEYALATSPCLSSICSVSTYYDTDGNIDYGEEAILQMVGALAPNLRSVSIWYQVAGNSLALLEALRSERPPWRGFFAKDVNDKLPQRYGCLTKLAFRGGSRSMNLAQMQTWASQTDLSRLRSLDISTGIDQEAAEFLHRLAADSGLPCLRSLRLEASYLPEEAVDGLIGALDALEGLAIDNYLGPATISAIIGHHGTSLTRFCLSELLSDDQVIALRQGCPNIRILHVTMKRRHGNIHEVNRYQLLGSFKRLERLILQLDCDDSDAWESQHGDDGDQAAGQPQDQGQRIQSGLINHAIDAHLARSIFDVISAANRAALPGLIPSFHHLKLGCIPAKHVTLGYYDLLRWLARSWEVCNPLGNDDNHVFETAEKTRMLYWAGLKEYMEEDFKWCDDGELYRPAWDALWPEARGEADWVNKWHGFPLYTTSDM
jgi:hypothetical protein